MREFVAKTKKIKITINGASFEMKCPTLGEQESLEEMIKTADNVKVMGIYKEFFKDLGLPTEACESMDSDDFLEFIKFVFNPNSKGPQPTV